MINIIHVSKHYHNHTALDDVSLDIREGRVFGLLGPNGAGKTSLIRIINHITKPDQGEVLYRGRLLSESDVERIGYLPEERGLYRKMKVGEQAIYLARLKGLTAKEAKQRLEAWFEKFDIMPWWHKKVEELSKGMQQKVQFVCTVLHEPELLIFDEPFSGFDPVNAELLKAEILELKRQGKTIIFSSHNMHNVDEICDDVALISRSKLVLSGAIEEVRSAHGSSAYVFTLEGDVPREAIPIPDIQSYTQDGRYTTVKVSVRPEASLRALVLQIPEHYPLVSCQREIPSMHEIFLSKVQNYGE